MSGPQWNEESLWHRRLKKEKRPPLLLHLNASPKVHPSGCRFVFMAIRWSRNDICIILQSQACKLRFQSKHSVGLLRPGYNHSYPVISYHLFDSGVFPLQWLWRCSLFREEVSGKKIDDGHEKANYLVSGIYNEIWYKKLLVRLKFTTLYMGLN